MITLSVWKCSTYELINERIKRRNNFLLRFKRRVLKSVWMIDDNNRRMITLSEDDPEGLSEQEPLFFYYFKWFERRNFVFEIDYWNQVGLI